MKEKDFEDFLEKVFVLEELLPCSGVLSLQGNSGEEPTASPWATDALLPHQPCICEKPWTQVCLMPLESMRRAKS